MTSIQPFRNRWKSLSRLQKTLINLLVWGGLIAAYFIWQSNRLPGAALYGHNHTDRPIYSYFVNDNWGGNGGVTCCWRIVGKTLKVDWIKSMTRTQYEQGAREETLSVEIPNPPRKRTDDTLHVHFLPGDQIRVAWSDKHTSPLKEELKEFYAKDQESKSK
ncbi:Protein of unknown function [Pseudomonas chlororaphis]|uniref:DUF3304 domain-containing protein n=1 Tax=Pseudomonas chlororaphis subsp. aurantiaca TaxID=86192 RepID=A0AAJ0ZFS3_9PSED|nr:DUF3304 domain-containing protein [Pseudomonas chlororaphis]AZD22249.1 hypothetical protein C4K24_2946 [Pseudomonas chlororaphis subsp. aurantiaca]AZD66847.1 hypothetical protein C4K17_2961 [Pseudomonas chlororaphis subsp. aurantiaca]AZD73326.1 hypothetical protein C4K16_2966 [Pseudomonas chlororaphis subsp. aurantiaca]MBU4631742.1 DUF3304 domain-containing protein [Pseudomonas chlororaphis subsp. aurantiaca]QIT22882.1 DUF3304 domain-containing protein [Pseudomonas chlororaphis subsp. auran